jgi:hypothetical protein
LLTATGGAGGGPTAGAAGSFTALPQGIGFRGLPGGQGGNPLATTGSIQAGGNSFQNWGFGGTVVSATPAPAGTGFGAGGGGGQSTGTPIPVAGGAGTIGYVIVEEFY